MVVRFVKYLSLLTLMLLAFQPSNAIAEDASSGEIKIGVIAPLTGPAAQLGGWIQQGVSLAEDKLLSQGIKVQFIVEDDQCSGKSAVSAFNKLTDADDVKFIIGPLCGAASVPVAPLAERKKVLLLTTGLASENVLNAGEYTFSVLPSMASVAAAIVDYAVRDLRVKKLSLLHSEDEYGSQNEKAARFQIDRIGGLIVNSLSFARNIGDFRTEIAKLKADESEAVLIVGYPPDYLAFLKQAEELSFSKPLLAVATLQAPDVAKSQSSSRIDVVYGYPSRSDLSSVREFGDRFSVKYGSTSNFLPMYVGSAYDAAMLLAEAILRCHPADTKCVQQKVLQTKDYSGANGPISFDASGNNQNAGSVELRVLHSGSFVALDERTTAGTRRR